MRRVHKLKTVAPFYQALQDGVKTFEVRYDDRAYRTGDFLHLCEWDGEKFTGRNVWRRVSYVLSSGQFAGLAPGYVCMGFGEPLDYETTARLIGAASEKSGDQKSTTGAERGERSRGLGEQQNGESLVVSAPPPVAGVTECGACDKPGEHCSNIYGICSRHGGHPPRTSGETGGGQ